MTALIETICEQERELIELKALTREAETLRQANVGERHRQAGQQRGKSLTGGSPRFHRLGDVERRSVELDPGSRQIRPSGSLQVVSSCAQVLGGCCR